MSFSISLLLLLALFADPEAGLAAETSMGAHHQGKEANPPRQIQPCRPFSSGADRADTSAGSDLQAMGFEGLQIETADVARYEGLFETVLKADKVQSVDHPQKDLLRGYCFRGVLIVVRQDLSAPRPTGWVQINFAVPDVAGIQRDLERAYAESPVAKLAEAERSQIVRFRLKPDVRRGACRAIRFEVAGPEGFMIGFDQIKRETCESERHVPIP